jgi:hypothetical protein
MLDQWLHSMSIDDFIRTYLRRIPYAQPSTANAMVPIFGWHTLERILVRRSGGRPQFIDCLANTGNLD